VDVAKSVRLKVFFERLSIAQPANSQEEAFDLLAAVLNEVEDEMTTIPFNPANWRTDDRMYPPQPDSIRDVPNHPNVKRYRSVGHNTYFANNGSIEITAITSEGETLLFSKAGSNGKGVWDK
jgi:hypothetical protein